jgi:uncharacterized phiE125 gp8 family phage protein
VIRYVVTTPPASEPVTVAEAKTHCFIESGNTDWDIYIGTLIQSAREFAEKYTGRALMTQTIIQYWDSFPGVCTTNPYGAIKLFMPPVQSITSVKYIDEDEVEQTLTVNTQYKIDTVNEPTQIVPAYDTDWPDTLNQINSVYVEYVAGYSSAANVPQAIKDAMLLAIKETFDCRDNTVRKFPTKAEYLLNMYKIHAL